jgi:hypothetical protein
MTTTQIATHPLYTAEDLKTAFDKVADPTDWKNPFVADVILSDLGVTLAAIEHYTACPVYYVKQVGNVFTLRCDGYRMGPAGDH